MPGNYNIKRLLRYVLATFFIVAGANHFLDPNFYLPLIPPYFPYPETINWVSGILELLFGGLLFFKKYSLLASYGLLVLLFLFIPSHVYFIKLGSCIQEVFASPNGLGGCDYLQYILYCFSGFGP